MESKSLILSSIYQVACFAFRSEIGACVTTELTPDSVTVECRTFGHQADCTVISHLADDLYLVIGCGEITAEEIFSESNLKKMFEGLAATLHLQTNIQFKSNVAILIDNNFDLARIEDDITTSAKVIDVNEIISIIRNKIPPTLPIIIKTVANVIYLTGEKGRQHNGVHLAEFCEIFGEDFWILLGRQFEFKFINFIISKKNYSYNDGDWYDFFYDKFATNVFENCYFP